MRKWNLENKPEDECWLYPNARKDGYVVVHGEYAHRLSWIENRGAIPPDLQVLHKCDVRNCVNPNHLYLGDQSRNMCDRIERRDPNVKTGRTAYKFDENDILNMKAMKDSGSSCIEISKRFNCSRQYVSLLLHGKRGKNIRFHQKSEEYSY